MTSYCFQQLLEPAASGEPAQLNEMVHVAMIKACNLYGQGRIPDETDAFVVLGNAKKVFRDFLDRYPNSENIAAYNAVLGVTCRAGDIDYALEVFHHLQSLFRTQFQSCLY